ncbi:BolA family protein [Gloeobacter kilaueensis]|uniref:BolA family protein n=1 Tax=Gloeobacter kilaueensis (strain ATCC BAA-2537 / CCAP 1431/1 / ULC 316 / JS1) TaxID=1183438 RepID=U5QK67_GLOK1|nr:BolA family protein [Gloeobacter kilaueensis]AGY59288.1 BolA family protein [Gloeobacter kilaueensis JS1]
MITAEQIKKVLEERLAASCVSVEDRTRFHAGHAGSNGGGHYDVTVVSERFAGLSMLRQHRLVYEALAGEMGLSIHALALTTLTPEQWRSRQLST